MSEVMWMALALARLAVRAEILEQDNDNLRRALESAKGPRAVDAPKKASDTMPDAT